MMGRKIKEKLHKKEYEKEGQVKIFLKNCKRRKKDMKRKNIVEQEKKHHRRKKNRRREKKIMIRKSKLRIF